MGEIKIIGGSAGGRKIKTCKGLYVRPMLARVKKALFDILQNRIIEARCLDLFSGSGSIGLEAISRGAKHVTFIEKNHVSQRTINYNINLLGFGEKSTLIGGDVFSVLKKMQEKFDIIFLDPPFKTLILNEILEPVSKSNVLKENGILIIHHPTYNNTFIDTIDKLKCIKQARYGQNVLSFYKNIFDIKDNFTLNFEGR